MSPATSAFRITLGAGKARPQGSTIDVHVGAGGPVEALAATLRGLPTEVESWWAPYEYDGAYREVARWRSACGVAIDADFHDELDQHVAVPVEVADEVLAAAQSGELPGSLFHLTPRGMRVGFVFTHAVTDRGVRDRAVRGAAALVERALARLHFAPNGSARGLSVDTAAIDAARFMYAPNAIVGGVARTVDVLVIRSEPIDPMTLAEAAPEDAVRAPEFDARQNDVVPLTDFDRAVAAFNAVHPLDIPKSSGPCPACGHDGCFGRLAGDPGRWSCFSASHEKDSGSCGLHGPTCWHGDALDLAAREARLSRGSLLRRDGFLIDPLASHPDVKPGRPLPTHDREAEVALLASFLKDFAATSAACRSVGGVSASDFFDEGARRAHLAMLAIEGRGGRPDELSVRIELDGRAGPDALADVVAAGAAVAIENAPIYAKRVLDLARARADQAAFDEIRREIDRGGASALAMIEAACVRRREEFALADGGEAFGWATTEEVLAEPEEDWALLWEPILARSAVTLFAAAPKAGKTWLIFAFLGAVCRGVDWLGRKPLGRSLRVLIVSEEPRFIVRRRLRQFGISTGVDILTIDKMPSGTTWPMIVEDAGRRAEAVSAEVVVFDTISTLAGILDENDNSDVNAALLPTVRLARAQRVAVAIVHHARKGEGPGNEMVRGGTAFVSVPDCIVTIRKVGGETSRKRSLSVSGRLPDAPDKPIVVEWVKGANGEPDGYELEGDAAVTREEDDLDAALVRIERLDRMIGEALDGELADATKAGDPGRAWLTRPQIGERSTLSKHDLEERLPVLVRLEKIQRGRASGRGGGFTYSALGVPASSRPGKASRTSPEPSGEVRVSGEVRGGGPENLPEVPRGNPAGTTESRQRRIQRHRPANSGSSPNLPEVPRTSPESDVPAADEPPPAPGPPLRGPGTAGEVQGPTTRCADPARRDEGEVRP